MNSSFVTYVKDHIKDYLPYRFQDAHVFTHPVHKANGINLIGLNIRNNLDRGTGNIYLNEYEERYQKGSSIEELMQEIADSVIETENFDTDPYAEFVDNILDYEKMKSYLAIRLVDIEKSTEFLKDKPYKTFGPYAITYRIQIPTGKKGLLSSTVIYDLIFKQWDISLEQLHQDAIEAERKRSPILFYENTLENTFLETETDLSKRENLFNRIKPLNKLAPMYTLTNKEMTNGAAVLIQEGVLKKIGKLLRENFYILPSSIHEFMIVPDRHLMNLSDYDKMVKDINETYIETQDVLSDKALYYNRKNQKIIYNK